MNNESNSPRDALFAQPLGSVAEFTFDKRVADVFPDMLKRSIPGYQAIISQSGLLCAQFAQQNSNIYDLGCSLGATSLAMRKALFDARAANQAPVNNCQIHAIDNSEAMLEKAKDVLIDETDSFVDGMPIQLHRADIRSADITNASVVAMNFTMQFIEPADRDALIQRIADGLIPGGAFILSEKVTFADPVLRELHINMYHKFKSANGYSELEISQKRTALENVMVPDTLDTHMARLQSAGFSSCSVWFQCFNFASIIALK